MNRTSFALFVALLIHFLFFFVFLFIDSITPNSNKVTPPEKRMKISLKELIKAKKPVKKDIKKHVKVPPPMPKGRQLKKIIPKKTIIFKPKKKPTPPKLNPKPVKQTYKVKKVEPLVAIKPFIPLQKIIKEPKIRQDKKQESVSGMDWLMEDKSQEIKPQYKRKTSIGASAGKNIEELYGSDFAKLSIGQQEYILNNQEIMRRITQKVLNRQASVSNIETINTNKTNTIEFYLHPNGDMSDFKFLEKSGYFILDDITKSTIEYSYSKYPRPTEKTLIRYNVFYNLRRY